jgi:heme/copper-type cytochrome/quinol oxidase subunit 2
MRAVILGLCGVVAAAVFLAMYLSVWSTREGPGRAAAFRQHIVSELVWATIPILMLIAAALPAAIAVTSGGGTHQKKDRAASPQLIEAPARAHADTTGWADPCRSAQSA